jgi:hypothetical protein
MSNIKYLVIESRWTGFFSNFCHTVQHLRRAEVKGHIPIVYWHGGCYAKHPHDTENIWEYYFKPVSNYSIHDIDLESDQVKITSKYLKTNLPGDPQGCWDYKIRPPKNCLNSPNRECRLFVKDTLNKFITIVPHVQDKIDSFYKRNMKETGILGVHYRETKDVRINPKWMGENPFKQFCELINKHLHNNPDDKIYLATDSYPAIDKFKNIFAEKIIHYNAIRSDNYEPIQYGFQTKDVALKEEHIIGIQAGEESLIECLLLSKCDTMIHGISNLSAFAGYFNPDLNLVFAGRKGK